ncbi:MAG: DUF3365 domain-containing protein [candidate division NC10 bacterium]|nr:DUF3365 domain-containing protein [candidate division NC10 bacterium]
MKKRHVGIACVVIGGAILSWASAADLPGLLAVQQLALRVVEETRELMQVEVRARGPAGALQQCSKIALGLAKQHEEEGWRVRRVSVKYRNPADAPDEYEARVLDEFAALKAKGELQVDTEHADVVTEEGRRYLRYMKPIVLRSPVCLSCHGQPDEISPEVKAELQRLYPQDKATGYRVADLRGAVSVKIPLGAGE